MNLDDAEAIVLQQYPDARILSKRFYDDFDQLNRVWKEHRRVFENREYRSGVRAADRMLEAIERSRIIGELISFSFRGRDNNLVSLTFNSVDMQMIELPQDFVRFVDAHWDDYKQSDESASS